MHVDSQPGRTRRAVRWAVLAAVLVLPATAQHQPVTLYDKDFNEINPMTGENAGVPFSPKNTCGTCHDYETITSSYHFQMGWDKISDDFGKERGRPWDLSDGFMGRWYPYAYRQLAKKKNAHPDEIDLTVYDFVGFSRSGPDQPPCGACHPGGGGLEYDRDGNRYDERLRENPELRDTLDGDYYRSRWDASGVVEADCFICHWPRYDFAERVRQLEMGNYQWAVVAATGLGIVEGSVADGEQPRVTYNRRFFNEDGTLTPPVSWPPPGENCVFCHGTADVKKRGFSWKDIRNPDIHQQQGMACVACHTAGLDHQITKGDEFVSTVADELDNTMMGCRECHRSGYHGASIPRHRSVRPGHVEAIACETCHIPKLHRAAALWSETTTGELVFTTNPPTAEAFGEHAEWYPVYERRDDGRIYPVNEVFTSWWGNLDEDGIVYPLFLREQKAAWERFSEAVTDDNGDGKPEVNREEEIVAGLRVFSETLQGNRRFRRIHPVFLKGRDAWHLGEDGRLAKLDYDVTGLTSVIFSINHIVAPARMALGAQGCRDCHATDARFFTGPRIVDPYDASGAPVTEANGLRIGCEPWAFYINALHQQILSPAVSTAIVLVIFLIVVHYHSYGPKRIPFEPFSHEILRFTLLERFIHLFRLIAFVVLAVTGLIMAFNWTPWQELFFRSPDQMLEFHIVFGIVFIITTVMGIVVWFRDALFADYDKHWVRIIGGYLGYKGAVPAGRFNAGQKMFYWYTAIFGLVMSVTRVMLIYKKAFDLADICFTATVHNLFGFILIAGVLAHAYLGTIANPGTWRVLVDGYVTKEWAKHHHPYWYRELVEQGKIRDDEGRPASGDQRSDDD